MQTLVKRKKKNIVSLFLIFLFSVYSQNTHAVTLAFWGAQGFGAITSGGRGGSIVEVTTLADVVDSNDGVTSFREALMMQEPRTVIFKVSGNIELTEPLRLTAPHSFLTIAGQSAPGDGVQLKGRSLDLEPGVHDVIIRFMRFRPGEGDAENIRVTRGLSIYGTDTEPTYNIIVDHCSVFWSPDESVDIWGNAYNVTIQWSLIAEGLYAEGTVQQYVDGVLADNFIKERSKSLLIGQKSGSATSPYNISIHHNYFANNDQRNPSVSSLNPVHVINNLIYNWGGFGAGVQNFAEPKTGVKMNLIGNVYREGPNTNISRYEVGASGYDLDPNDPNPDDLIYVEDNVGPHRPQEPGGVLLPEWSIVGSAELLKDSAGNSISYWSAPAPIELKREDPWERAPAPFAVTIHTSEELPQLILDGVGANFPVRDDADQRQITDYENNTGRMSLQGQAQIETIWPTLQSGPLYIDSDADGMPDNWESYYGLNPNDSSDANGDQNGDGYTNIETYLNARAVSADIDADGIPDSGDCSPNNANIYPGATEIPGDGIDQNCNGDDLVIVISAEEYSA